MRLSMFSPDMRNRAEFVETEHAARSLDRVYRAEDAGQKLFRARRLFQLDQIAVEPIETFRCSRLKTP